MDKMKALILWNFTALESETPSGRKSVTLILVNIQKSLNKKYGKLLAKKAEDIPQNKFCLYIIGFYIIRGKIKKKYLHSKAVTGIHSNMG